MANNLFTLGLDITATQNRMSKQLKQIAKNLSDSNTVRVTGSLDTTKSQNLIQQQLNSISKNLKNQYWECQYRHFRYQTATASYKSAVKIWYQCNRCKSTFSI